MSINSLPLISRKDLENQFRNTKAIFFVGNWNNPEYYRYLCEIAWIANSVSGEIHIVRYNIQDSSKIERFQTTFFQKLSEIFPRIHLTNLPASMQIEGTNNQHVEIATLEQAFLHNDSLGHSIVSILMSSLISVPGLRSKKLKKIISKYSSEFIQSEIVCDHTISKIMPDFVIIPNGRFPDQAGLRATAEKNKIPFLIFERGTKGNGRFHLQPHQTQDFDSMRRYYLEYFNANRVVTSASPDKSTKFLDLQKNDSSFNPFAKRWTQNAKNIDSRQGNPFCVFFTSSTDERYSNLGIDMNGWGSQEQAIIQTYEALKRSGFDFLVRIHPNAAWKTWAELRRMTSALKRNGITFVLPWEIPGTYELLQKISLAATWGSTVCIEATALGIPTINLGRTPYDNVIDVLVVNPQNIDTINFRDIPKPIASKSIRFFNTRLQYGFQVEKIDSDDRFNEIKALCARDNFPVESEISFGTKAKSLKKYFIQPQYAFLITKRIFGYNSSVFLLRNSILFLEKLPTRLSSKER